MKEIYQIPLQCVKHSYRNISIAIKNRDSVFPVRQRWVRARKISCIGHHGNRAVAVWESLKTVQSVEMECGVRGSSVMSNSLFLLHLSSSQTLHYGHYSVNHRWQLSITITTNSTGKTLHSIKCSDSQKCKQEVFKTKVWNQSARGVAASGCLHCSSWVNRMNQWERVAGCAVKHLVLDWILSVSRPSTMALTVASTQPLVHMIPTQELRHNVVVSW